MIYLLRKHGIISVPSYAEGIYHPPKVGIISKIYHPFREDRISLKTPSLYHNEGVFMAETERFELSSPLGLTHFESFSQRVKNWSFRVSFRSFRLRRKPHKIRLFQP